MIDEIFTKTFAIIINKRQQSVNNNSTNLFVGTFTGPLVQVDVGLLQHNIGKPSADTFDGGHGEHDFTFAIDVRTHDTQDVLEFLGDDQRLKNNKTTINDTFVIDGDWVYNDGRRSANASTSDERPPDSNEPSNLTRSEKMRFPFRPGSMAIGTDTNES